MFRVPIGELLDAAREKSDSPEKRSAIQVEFLWRYMHRYALNAQRVDLR